MYLSRMRLKGGGKSTPAFWRAFTTDGYALHQAVWSVFGRGPDDTRSFLYRAELRGRDSQVYVLSEAGPVEEDSGLWHVESKPFDVVLKKGQRLVFELRANATVTRDGKRHDVVMDLKTKKGKAMTQNELAQEAGEAWLKRRSQQRGFRPEVVRVDGYRRFELMKGDRRKPIRLSTLDLTGILVVEEPDAFREVLHKGMGRARSFGCGLMMIRPA